MSRLLTLIILLSTTHTDKGSVSASVSDNWQAQESVSVQSTEEEGLGDYRHNIKMLTGVDDVRKMTEYKYKENEVADEPANKTAPVSTKKEQSEEPLTENE